MKTTSIVLCLTFLCLALNACNNPWKRAEDLEAKLQTQEERLKQLDQEKQQLQLEYDHYRERYRIEARKLAEGESVGSLKTKDGKEYLGVTITRVDEDYIYFTHSTGAGRAALEEVPENWQERFDYQPVQTITGSKAPESSD